MRRFFIVLLCCLLTAVNALAQFASAPAFPGAEGHGRYTTGGRGGTVVHVTNLNDSGTGSFRAAVTGGSNRTIVFDVAGVIALESDIKMKDNLTILGQTAPSPGITLRYYTVQPGANNIVRFIRFRRGQEKDINDGADATWQRNVTGLILDHCSFSWSIDEIASFYDNNNFTMQWCTIGESLTNPGHSKGAHGYGGIWGGKLASFHHNMIAHVMNRGPRFNGARYLWDGYTNNKEYSTYNWGNTVQAENVDFRNCVMYNAQGTCYGGPGGGQINIVNNYFKAGPSFSLKTTKDANENSIDVNSSSSVRGNQERITTISVANSGNATNSAVYTMTSRYYINGNTVQKYAANNSGAKTANRDWNGISYDSGVKTLNGEYYTPDPNNYYGSGVEHTTIDGVSCVKIKMTSPCPVGSVTTHTADNAFTKVLTYAGASLYRDNVDARYATEAQNGTATYKGSVTQSPGIIDKVSDVNGYTEANFGTASHPANYDTDGDGIPDEWETAHGLTVGTNNAVTYVLDSRNYYTDLEVYANSLVEEITKAERAGATETFDEYYPSLTSGGDTPTVTPSEWFANSSTSIAASQTYTNDANIKVTTSIAGGLNSDPQTINSQSVTHGINVRNDTGSTELTFAPKVDGELKIYIRRQWPDGAAVNDGKDINLYNGSTKETGVLVYNDNTTISGYALCTKTYSLTANTTYKLTASGTTGRLYGYIFTPSSSTPTTVDGTETTPIARTGNEDFVGLCYTVPGTYVGGQGNSSKAIKFNLCDNKIVIDVNPNYTITGFTFTGNDNDNTSGITINSVTVDGGSTNVLGSSVTFATDKSENSFTVSNINATQNITISAATPSDNQLNGTIVFTYKYNVQPLALQSSAKTSSRNGSVTLKFNNPMAAANGTATLNGKTLIADADGTSLKFVYTGLNYGQTYTFTVPAGALKDEFNQTYDQPINITVTTDAHATVTKKGFDKIVSTGEELAAAIAAANSHGSERYRIFIKNGTYTLTGSGENKTVEVELSNGSKTNKTFANPITLLTGSNVSFIGESYENVTITNNAGTLGTYTGKYGEACVAEGIGNGDVLQISSTATGSYFQGVTIKTSIGDARGRDIAVNDKGNKTIMKDVCLWGYQDTYVSNNSNGRFYFDGGVLRGRTDYLCGKGDVYYDGVILQQVGTGGYLAVPSVPLKYGYIFNECYIKKETSDVTYYLGRPWGKGTPIALFINTKVDAAPLTAGWDEMSNGWPDRFAEYGTKTTSGTAVSTSGRKTTFATSHTNNPVLTSAEAEYYSNIARIMGGTDGWDPTEYTEQCAAPTAQLSGSTLTWNDDSYASSWIVFKDGEYYANPITNSLELTESGTYTVRAANAMGGLGEASAGVQYVGSNTFTVSYNMKGHGTAIADVSDVNALPATLPKPTADGWAFWGWFTDDACTNKAEKNALITKNTTLYAKWTDASTTSGAWSINFATIGDAERLADKAGVAISSKVARINDVDMGVAKMGNNYLNNNFVIQTETSWIYRTAQKAIYSQNGGNRSFGMRNMKAGQTITMKIELGESATTIDVTNATLESSTDNIWVYNVTADGDVKFSINRYSYIYNIQVSAAPTPITYDVKFYNGAEQFGETVQIESGQTVSAPTAPTKSGYTFRGWSLTDGGTTAETFPYSVTADVNFYAIWEQNQQGEDVVVGNTVTFLSSDVTSKTGSKTKEGVTMSWTLEGYNVSDRGNTMKCKSDGNTLTFSGDIIITSITINCNSSYSSNISRIKLTPNVGSVVKNASNFIYSWSGANNNVVLTFGLEDGQSSDQSVYVSSIDVTYLPATVTATVVTGLKFGSFSSVYNVDFGNDENADVKAYTAKVNGSKVELTRHTGVLPAGEGVILYAPGTTKSQTFNVAAEATALTVENNMIGVPVATYVNHTDGGQAFVVNTDALRPLSESGTIAAGKAYIRIANPSAISMVFLDVDEATGISDEAAADIIPANMKIFNLQGMEVKNPAKGRIYIINNKKCILK